jgi:hypothetical protein
VTAVRVGVVAAAAAIGVLIGSLKLAGVEGEPTKDIASEADVHALTGGISTAALLVWGATAGVAALAGTLLRRLGDLEASRCLLVAAAGIAFLGLDDALLLHEDIVPNQFGLPEPVYLSLPGLAALAWAYRFRALIRDSSDMVLFATMVFAFAVAVLVDVTNLWATAGEDWIGYVGLLSLAGWVFDTSIRLVTASAAGSGRRAFGRAAGRELAQ